MANQAVEYRLDKAKKKQSCCPYEVEWGRKRTAAIPVCVFLEYYYIQYMFTITKNNGNTGVKYDNIYHLCLLLWDFCNQSYKWFP